MDNWQLIQKIYSNYKLKKEHIFQFSDEVDKINELIAEDILSPVSFHLLDENGTMKQLASDPFTKKGWEFFLGM
jgi:hypothetical protein